MPVITFHPGGRTVEVAPGSDLLVAARAVGGQVHAPCGGKGTCRKCLVRVLSGAVEGDSLGLLPADAVADGWVLACRTRVADGPVTVELPVAEAPETGRFSDSEREHLLIQEELLPQSWQYDPLAIKWRLKVAQPLPEEGLGDLDRLVRAVHKEWGDHEVRVTLPVLRELPDVLRAAEGDVTATLVREGEAVEILALETGDTTTRHFGIAVDIGTTTVALHLVDLHLARILATRTAYNRQIRCGLDVISRIAYAKRPSGREELRTLVLDTINDLVRQACIAQHLDPAAISNAVLSGNTTMTHLVLGIQPEHIRLAPYVPAAMTVPDQIAGEVGIGIHPSARVRFSPNVGSYVGGDITAGLLCTDLGGSDGQVDLFIDIGTNGELVAGNRELLVACACSAGPAFEGGGIRAGMRASVGAIERVSVEAASGKPSFRTIGEGKPRGICGSGMIDLLANLLKTGWMDPSGRLDRSRPSEHIRICGREAWFLLVNAAESGTDAEIAIHEREIGNIVRAKAAIYAAMALMLQQLGMDFADVGRVFIAGGFGRFLDLEQAIAIGLLPDIERSRFRYIGNSSLTGSFMVLVSQEFRAKQEEQARRITYFDLSTDPTYMDQYTAALFLPHTDPKRFPSQRGR